MATATIHYKDVGHTRSLKESSRYTSVKIKESNRYKNVVIGQTLPFRVRFASITIPGYGPSNVPPIGIAIIGYNNYIL